MFGMIHRSARDMVLEQFNQTMWDEVLKRSKLDDSAFISGEAYPDEVTFGLVGTIADVAGLSVDDALYAFGLHWVANASKGPYATVLSILGRTLPESLFNLDRMHASIQIAMPEAKLPQFTVLTSRADLIEVEYRSSRAGLERFVCGLFAGLMKKFSIEGDVVFEKSDDGARTFKILIAA